MSLNAFSYAMDWQIVMLVLFSLLTDAGFAEGNGAIVLSSVLALTNLLLVGNIFWSTRDAQACMA